VLVNLVTDSISASRVRIDKARREVEAAEESINRLRAEICDGSPAHIHLMIEVVHAKSPQQSSDSEPEFEGSGTTGGVFLVVWQMEHAFTHSSISLSNPGHHM